MAEVVYKKVDPNNKKELEALFKLYNNLNLFLSAPQISFETRYWTEVKINENQENYYICYVNGEPIGFVGTQNYHIVKTEAVEDNIGVISEIYVLPKFQKEDYAFQLLQKGIDSLLENGKTSAIMHVQSDNDNRFLHFAIADKFISKTEIRKRSDGTIPYDYELLISDLKKVKKMTKKEIGFKAVKIRKKVRLGITEEDSSILMP